VVAGVDGVPVLLGSRNAAESQRGEAYHSDRRGCRSKSDSHVVPPFRLEADPAPAAILLGENPNVKESVAFGEN